MANANGAAPNQFMMTSLMESAKTTPGFLLAAGAVMIIAMATSKKAQNVIKTSVDLSRQDEGDDRPEKMFFETIERDGRSFSRFTEIDI